MTTESMAAWLDAYRRLVTAAEGALEAVADARPPKASRCDTADLVAAWQTLGLFQREGVAGRVLGPLATRLQQASEAIAGLAVDLDTRLRERARTGDLVSIENLPTDALVTLRSWRLGDTVGVLVSKLPTGHPLLTCGHRVQTPDGEVVVYGSSTPWKTLEAVQAAGMAYGGESR